VHGESGQATVEWVALVLAAALVLGGAGVLAGREADRGLGEAVAERIARAPAAAGGPAAATAPGRVVRKRPIWGRNRTGRADAAAPPPAAAAPPPVRAAPAPPAPAARAVDAFRSLRGAADVAKHAWIVCLGYERWRHELEHPAAPTEALPVDVALGIVNTCFNPHDYLLQEE
jgi:hypothetical protein